MTPKRVSENGAMAIEAALVIPVFLIVSLMAIMLTAKTLETSSAARTTAEEAARAASQQQTQTGAYNAAKAVISKGAKSNTINCSDLVLDADLTPGGRVTATVTCTGESRALPGFPAQTIRKTGIANEVVDSFRSGP